MNSSRVSHNAEVELDLKALMATLYDAKWTLLGASAVMAVLVGLLIFVQQANYSADARLLIAPQDAGFARSSVDSPLPVASADEAMFASQIQVLTSRDLASRVIDKLGIIDAPELQEGSLLSGLLGLGGGKDAKELALENFAKRLNIEAVDMTRVISVRYSSLKAGMAADIVNAVIEDYRHLQRNAKVENTKDATRLLETEIAKLRDRVRVAESKVEAFRSTSDLLQTAGDGSDTLIEQRLSDANAQLARVRSEKTEAQARASRVRALLKDGVSAESATEVASNPLIQRLKEQELAQRGQIAELSATLLPAHPRIKALKTQLTQTQNALRAEVRNILQGLENDARVAAAREKGLLQDLNRLKVDVAGVNEQSIKLRALEREATAQRQLLESFLARYREALSLQNPEFVTPDARIIARATVPSEPLPKNTIAKSIVAAIGTFLIGVVLVMFRAFFSGSVFKPVEHRQDLPQDATALPPGTYDHANHGYASPQSERGSRVNPASAQARNWSNEADVTRMAANMVMETRERNSGYSRDDVISLAAKAALENLRAGKARVVMLSSSEEARNVSSAKPVARAISQVGKNVVLVSLADPYLAGSADIGWEGVSDLIDGEASFSQVIYRDRLSRSHLVPSGSRMLAQSDIQNEMFQTLLAALGEAYDIVLVDTGPFYQDDEVIEGLSAGSNALALVLTAQESDEGAAEIGKFLKSIGYADVAIVISSDHGIETQDVA
ncbi:MAG: exopolysaccharide transport family protein [Cohaesibacter sp.]|nr:exopolysaccharide transport family protein [Cohaesibacter sp.]